MKTAHLKPTFFLLLYLLVPFNFLLASNEVIESLLSQLDNTKTEKQEIDLLNQLGYEYYQIDIEQTFRYSEQALEKAKRIKYEKGIAYALKYLAIGYSVKKDISKAIQYNQEALQIARQIHEDPLIAQTLNNLGINFEALGLSDRAIRYYIESLEYSAKTKDDKLRCFTFRNLGFLYERLGETDKSISYFDKSAEVARQSDHHMIKYIADLNEGKRYKRNKQYPEALEHLERSFELCSNNYSKATVLIETSKVYQEQKDWEKTKDYLIQAIQIIERSGNKDHLENTQLAYASVLFQAKDYKRCLSTLNTIHEDRTRGTNYSSNDKKLFQLLGETYLQLNDPQNAARYFQQLTTIQDSIYDRNKLDLITKLESKYQVEEKEKENAYLKAQQEQNEIILAQRKNALFYTILLSILILIVAVLLFRAYRSKQRFNQTLRQQIDHQTKELQKSNNQLKASNIELERFVYIASHDLKEPLRNIASFSGLIERQLEDLQEKPHIAEYLGFIKRNAIQMDRLIKDVLEFSRLGKVRQTEFKQTNLEEIVEQVKEALWTDIQEKNVHIKIIHSSPYFYIIPSQLFLVIKNLISNGIKYNTNELKRIEISYSSQDDKHQFSVKDNGIGIAPEYKNQVFEMFKRLHNRKQYQGTGLGLAICKKIVTNMGGEIWYESTGNGSTFYFTVPKQQKVL